ncbi:DUF1648 domain-containing protein [Cellulomonas triticagri]|uniref:DUF1648 domain-containing protein n=1 Tax=Cellulomonas triticagri TaxID=2483352 RepID=A0A3M2J471_9CELL|nr:DUF1648 domain-containing protein [Cellulomonas triticagri]RMI06710.1 DUF1648 domain-containing protein [Cellulomonas triticagri]
MTTTPAPRRTSTTLLGLVPGLVMLGAAAAVVLSWRDELPDRVATHWDAAGVADGFASPLGSVLQPLAIVVPVVVLMWVLALVRGHEPLARRLLIGCGTGIAWLTASAMVGTAWVQRGATDATQVPVVGGAIAIGVIGGLLLGGLCAWAAPGGAAPESPETAPVDGPVLALADGERAAWSRRTVSPVGVVAGLIGAVVLSGFALAAADPWLLAVAVVPVVLLAVISAFDVTVDSTGLTARSLAGRPRVHVPLDEVVGVDVTEVRPVRDFGGWGYRVGRGGGAGLITRGGPALRVRRTGDRSLTVTVDDPATAAALLTTLTNRTRSLP